MKIFSCIVLLIAIALASGNKAHSNHKGGAFGSLFEKFIKSSNRHYINKADMMLHYMEFVNSLSNINTNDDVPISNDDSNSATLETIKLADFTPPELEILKGFGSVIIGNVI